MSGDIENNVWRDQLVDAPDDVLAEHYCKIGTIGMNDAQHDRAVKFMSRSGQGKPIFPTGRRGERNQIRGIGIYDIHVTASRRPIDESAITHLMESIKRVGLLNPPAVRYVESMVIDGEEQCSVPVLVAG